MEELFASGRAIDLILAGIVLEALGLYAAQRAGWVRGFAVVDWLPGLASGALIMLALRGAISGAPWPLLSVLLLSSGAVHVLDLALRRRLRLRAAGASGSQAGRSPR